MTARRSEQHAGDRKVIATVSLQKRAEGQHVGTARFYRLPVTSADDYACEPPEAIDFAKARMISDRILERSNYARTLCTGDGWSDPHRE